MFCHKILCEFYHPFLSISSHIQMRTQKHWHCVHSQHLIIVLVISMFIYELRKIVNHFVLCHSLDSSFEWVPFDSIVNFCLDIFMILYYGIFLKPLKQYITWSYDKVLIHIICSKSLDNVYVMGSYIQKYTKSFLFT